MRNFFKLRELRTNVFSEITAGLSTFLALSYIFVVNPAILSGGGMNKSAVLFATVITSSLATIVMGLWAKKPFALAPGLEMNGYVVFYVIAVLGFSWQNALGIVFWSGVLFMILTLTNIRQKIILAIPDILKIGLAASVGIFLMLIALKIAGIIVYEGITIQSFTSPLNDKFYIFFVGLILFLLMEKLKVRASILLSIVGASLFGYLIHFNIAGVERVNANSEMFGAILKLDIASILNPKLFSALIILFIIDFYGSVAKFIGLTQNTPIVDKSGNMPNMKEALYVDGVATIVGSALGTTSVTTYVESGVGINAGGRSGLTAVVCGILMLLVIPLAPIINLVPVEATTGALFLVGLKLIPKIPTLKAWKLYESISVIIMAAVTFITFSLDKAMFAGFLVYFVGLLTSRQSNKINPYFVITLFLLLTGFVLSCL